MSDVDRHLDALGHARRADVDYLRHAIRTAEPEATETWKWNAPNFRFADEDRVTFRLRPGNRVELILHRGASVRADAERFAFHDPDGRLQWRTPDRAVLTVAEPLEPEAADAAVALAVRWMRTPVTPA